MAAAIAAAEAPPRARRTARLGVPPEWLWPLSILLQVASAAALTTYAYFFLDDWLFIAQARRLPFSIHYLSLGLYEHFSPISRLLDKLLVHNSTGSFALANGLEVLMYTAAIVAFAFVVRTILGNRWSAFALTVLFGQSLFLMRLLNWWTATANILPATIFGLLAFGAYLRWQRGRSRVWAVVSLASFLASLLDYENAILLPFYIAAVRLLVLEDDLRPRAWLAVVRREWVIWAGYLVLVVAALVNFYTKYYHPPAHHTSLLPLLHFLVVAIFAEFIPALFGIKYPDLSQEPIVVIACVVAALALTAYLVYRRPRAWRCVLAFVLFALVMLLPLGIARVGHRGVQTVATELYYQQSLQFMLLILVALALRCPVRRTPPRWLAAGRARLRAPAAWGSLLAAGAAAYGALLVASVHAIATASWNHSAPSRQYVRDFRASVQSTIDRTHREPVLFNARVPIIAQGNYASYDIIFPMMSSRVRFNAVTRPMYVVRPKGALEPVSFHAIAAGLLTRTTVLESRGSAVPAALRNGAVCAPAGAGRVRLRIPLQRAVSMRVPALDQFPRALRLFLRMPSRASVAVATHGQRSEQADAVFPPTFGRGTSGQYVPLNMNARALAIDVRLIGGACVSSLAVGSFAPAARS